MDYKKIILIVFITAIILRLILLVINPISMFSDAIIRYIPQTYQIIHLDFKFMDFPLFSLLLTFWNLLFSEFMLEIMWKATSFIFFIAILFLLPKLFKRFELNNGERVIVMALFFFSTWSLLLSTTIMQDIFLTFLTIALFLSIENYFEKQGKTSIFLICLLSFLMCMTKTTSYIMLAGFGLYILSKTKFKIFDKKNKIILFIALGFLLSLFWPIKNYLSFGDPFLPVKLNPISLHSFSEYSQFFVRTYHYFWEIPLQEKVGFVGTLGTLFNIFYFGTLIITALFSILLIISFIKYCKKNKEFLGLFGPILLFALIYWPFIMMVSDSDSGRYTFPLWIFSFIFLAKYISQINKKNLKLFCKIIVVLFCIVSIISAFGISIHMNSINNQIVDMSNKLKSENLKNVTIISNTEFAAASLNYYLKDYLSNPVKFGLRENVVDPKVICSGDEIFDSADFNIYKQNIEYRVCRK